jgi:hypothetical protein
MFLASGGSPTFGACACAGMVANTVATAAAPASAAKSRKQVGDFGDMAFPPGVMFRFWIAPAEASGQDSHAENGP